MNWKNWPYWLKGGVIGGGVAFLSGIFTDVCEKLFVVPNISLGLECFPFAIPWIPFWFVPNFTSLPILSYEVIVVGVWFLLGSLVGALVLYMKSKNKVVK